MAMYVAKKFMSTIMIGFAGKHPSLLAHNEDTDDLLISSCNKDLGATKRLRHWSRGHLFICRPCGHIEFSQPIYR